MAASLSLAACGHLPRIHAPWAHRQAPPPEVAHELVVTDTAGSAAAFPQYWKRNTLVVDLEGVSGSGAVVLRPRAGTTWPVRLALRVMPGSVGELDVRADERFVIPVEPAGPAPVDLELAPGAYTARTAEIRVDWSPVPAS